MGVLDTFYFILKADPSDAIRGLNRAGQGFDDLREDGRDATDDVSRNVDDMGREINRVSDVANGALGSIAGSFKDLILPAAAALGALTSVSSAWERIQGLVDTANNAQSLGIPVDQYDTFAKVLQGVGYEADETRDLFVDLAEAIGEGASDAESQRAKSFKDLGISLKDAAGNTINATQGFEALSKALDGMSAEKAIFVTRQLGISDPKVLTLLTKGNAELQKRIALAQQYGVMTAEQARAAQELQLQQQKLAMTLSGIGESIARGLLPYVTGVFKAINEIIDYVNQHKIAFSLFFGIPATVIGAALIPALVRATIATGQLAVATVIATWPWLAMAAAVAAVAIAAEDLYLYFTDPTANTLTGDLVKKFPALGEAIETARQDIMGFVQGFKDIYAGATEMFDGIIGYFRGIDQGAASTFNALNPRITSFLTATKDAFLSFYNWFRGLGLQIGDFFRDIFAGVINSVVDSIPAAAQKALGVTRMRTGAERRTDATADQLAADLAAATQPPSVMPAPAVAANSVIGQASRSPINSIAGSGVGPSARTVNNNGGNVTIEKMEITTQSTDPQEVRSAIVDGIQGEWKNAVQQHDDGISH